MSEVRPPATTRQPSAEAAPDAVLAVQDLYKAYGALIAVDRISFAVQPGETFGILGPNGAGKTTTLEMIEGLRDPDGGAITFLGLDAVKNRKHMQGRIGVQLQSQTLWPELTVEETLKLFRSLFPQRLPVNDLLDRFSLTDKRRALVKGLSGGQKQRLCLATALVNDPTLIFLDEPTTGLDPQARHSFWDLIRDLHDEGKTIIITTHYMEEAEALCDRVAIMDSGRILDLDTPHKLVHRLAAESTIECAFREGSVTAAELAALPGVRDVHTENGSAVLYTSDVSTTLSSLVHAADNNRAPIKDLNVRSSTLEDVFMLLTGRRLRD